MMLSPKFARQLLPAFAGLFIVVSAARADAQTPPAPINPEPEASAEREGFLVGLTLGFGSLDTGSQSDVTFNYRFGLGGFINPLWAIAVDFWGAQYSDGFVDVSTNSAGFTVQRFLQNSFWLKGSLGTAHLVTKDEGFTRGDYDGVATGAMVGWDFFEHGAYHFQATAGVTFEGYEEISDNVTAVALQIGVQYY